MHNARDNGIGSVRIVEIKSKETQRARNRGKEGRKEGRKGERGRRRRGE